MALVINTTRQILLLAVLTAFIKHQAPVAVARQQKPAAPRNATFASCNSGTSRLVRANLDQIPQDCRPLHNHVAAAVHACFETVRIRVQSCQLLVHPTAKTAKESPICKLVYAKGALTGPSNASLVAVFNQVRFNSFLGDHPDFLKNFNASTLQRTFLNSLAQLYGRAVIVPGKGKCSVAAAASHKAKVTQDKQREGSSGRHSSDSKTQSGVDAKSGNHKEQKDAAAATTGPQKASTAKQGTKVAAGIDATAGNTSATPISTHPGKAGVATEGNSTTAAGAYKDTANNANKGKASGTNSSDVTIPGSIAASNSTGHKRLLLDYLQQQQIQMQPPGRHLMERAAVATTDAASASYSPGAAIVHDSSRADPESGSVVITPVRALAAEASDVCTEEQEAQEAEEEFQLAVGNSSSSIGNAKGSVLYRQGSKHIVLQPNDHCRFKYVVIRNPSLLRPAEGLKASASAGGTAGGRRRGGVVDGVAAARSPSAEGVAWTVFSSISVMLGVLSVYMAVKLIPRRGDKYDALQTSETAPNSAANGGRVQMVPTAGFCTEDGQDGQQRPNSIDFKQSASLAWSEPGDTCTRDDRSRLLKDSSRSEGGASYGRGR